MKLMRLATAGALATLTLSACGSGTSAAPAAPSGAAPGAASAAPAAAPSTGAPTGGTAAPIRLWLNGTDTPKAARTWLVNEFAKANPGATLKIEEQQWEGLVERLTTSLSSESETPVVVEVGSTQSATFTSVGAFSDLTDVKEQLGGNDLLPAFVEAGTSEGRTYAVPYYAGSKFVFYPRICSTRPA